MTPPRIAIIGAGAIGSVLAARLCSAGLDVTLVARGGRREAILRDGIHLTDLDGARHARPAVTERLEAPVSTVFLCVKAAALEPRSARTLPGSAPRRGSCRWSTASRGGSSTISAMPSRRSIRAASS
ncbi:2-dehydropantoate 2-reductase N-terminal domain-containing protein [Mangrovicoccus ximenensis]|uniref:2-dehydropantoate 2-reductase N-terminal domain-containing protein n=1 Tax=Mangrovicoccus ximenensis TaxID=1911570 RepID=UPI000D38DCDC|nr:2-dehydropantoate 2-reductase N-terminal domain-containing protein [Mangrovicoccus ximenensis]